MPFQPRIDPVWLETDCPTSTDASVPELVTFARRVDRIAAQSRVLSAFGHRQPCLHNHLPTCAHVFASALNCCEVGALERADLEPARIDWRGCRRGADIDEREVIASRR